MTAGVLRKPTMAATQRSFTGSSRCTEHRCTRGRRSLRTALSVWTRCTEPPIPPRRRTRRSPPRASASSTAATIPSSPANVRRGKAPRTRGTVGADPSSSLRGRSRARGRRSRGSKLLGEQRKNPNLPRAHPSSSGRSHVHKPTGTVAGANVNVSGGTWARSLSPHLCVPAVVCVAVAREPGPGAFNKI